MTPENNNGAVWPHQDAYNVCPSCGRNLEADKCPDCFIFHERQYEIERATLVCERSEFITSAE